MCTAAILAGGRARRLGGRSKALLSIGDQRIIDHQIAVLRTVADELAIVAPDTDRYGALGVPVWADVIPDSGPLGGIYTALVNATSSHMLVVASDMPFVTASFLKIPCGSAKTSMWQSRGRPTAISLCARVTPAPVRPWSGVISSAAP